jgi:nucleoside phosphorylase
VSAPRVQTAALTAIVSPLAAELAPVRAATAVERVERTRTTLGGLAFGRLGGGPVVLAATGDGARAAARGLAALLDAAPVGRLLVLGVGGGLSPNLAPGDLVAARQVVEAGREVAAADPAWLAAAAALGAIPGTVLTAPRILVTPEEKRAAWRGLEALGSEPGSATVDLESAAYARLAAARGIPLLVVRAVVDAASEALPLDFNRCRREEAGGVDEALVVGRALWRPRVWRGLADLRRRLRRSALALARLAIQLAAAPGESMDDGTEALDEGAAVAVAGSGGMEAARGSR